MEPARRFAPRTWLPRLPAATGRSRARVSITRLFTSSRLAYAFAVLLRLRDPWRKRLDSLTDRVEVHREVSPNPLASVPVLGGFPDHPLDAISFTARSRSS